MKIRNKKTSEIKNVNHNHVLIHFNDGETKCIKSLVELNEEWEDYEEPKEIWTITMFGEVQGGNPEEDIVPVDPRLIDRLKEIGNYFKTKEEAEKAVEKLKAWKRLKDKGFRFERWLIGCEYGNTITFSDYFECDDKTRADLDLLFGGEE